LCFHRFGHGLRLVLGVHFFNLLRNFLGYFCTKIQLLIIIPLISPILPLVWQAAYVWI
jgi:hypothetical protein